MIEQRRNHGVRRVLLTLLLIQLVLVTPGASHESTILIKILERNDQSPSRRPALHAREHDHRNEMSESEGSSSAKQVEMQKPQIQIHLLKGHVDPSGDWGYSTEYQYSDRDYDDRATNNDTKRPSENHNRQKEPIIREESESNRSVASERPQVPPIGSRNIVDGRMQRCQSGQLRDMKGICRDNVRSMFPRNLE